MSDGKEFAQMMFNVMANQVAHHLEEQENMFKERFGVSMHPYEFTSKEVPEWLQEDANNYGCYDLCELIDKNADLKDLIIEKCEGLPSKVVIESLLHLVVKPGSLG